MTKNKVKLVMVVLMLMVVCLYFVSGTYARYASAIDANAEVTVAKWAVAFPAGTDEVTNELDLTFTVTENPNVVPGRIAPSTTATATIEVDLTGTEVAVDWDAKIKENTNLSTLFGGADVTLSTTATFNGQPVAADDKLIELVDGTALNGKLVITLTLTWENDDTNNVADTTLGETAGTLTVPVEVSIQQHID